MRSRALLAPLAVLLAVCLVLPANAGSRTLSPAPQVTATPLTTFTLPETTIKSVLPSVASDAGFVLGGIGSGLFRKPGDPAGEYWMVTDRGPNGQIRPPGVTTGSRRRTFPIPDFSPLIIKVKTENGLISITQVLSITDSSGVGVTGLSNLSGSDGRKDEVPYDITATNVLSYNQNGLDTEGIVRASNGDFWLVDEYRPSIVQLGSNGQVTRRYIPAGISLPQATYPISANLPGIFDLRKRNRGFEGIALSPDESRLFVVLQSPLSNPDTDAGEASRNTRILVFDTQSLTPTAQFVYQFDDAAIFDPASRIRGDQDEMKLSGVIAESSTSLIILERTDLVAKLYRVNLAAATNILGSQWDDPATAPSLEQTTDLATAGVTPLPKQLVADLDTIGVPDKIEGIALADADTVAIANDNDFDINADTGLPNTPRLVPSQIMLVDIPAPLELPNRVAAGDVTQTSAVLWARAATPGTLTFEYGTSAAFASGTLSTTKTVTDVLIPASITVTGLISGTQYYYRATDAAGYRSAGSFRTPAAAGSLRGLRFGVSGDWRGELAPYPAIVNAPARNLDFFVAHGDTVYADYSSPDVPLTQTTKLEEYRLKNNEVYATRHLSNTWGDLRSSTALLATIDDHEVTNDFQGGATCATDPRFTCPTSTTLINESPLYLTGMQAFQEYNPLRNDFYGATGDPRTAGKLKLYRSQSYGRDGAVFVLDARSFRDPGLPGVTDLLSPTEVLNYLIATFTPTRTMLGAQQFVDLQQDLLAAEKAGVTWKFVLIPEPIQNLGVLNASDRYEGYAAERSALLDFIKRNNIRNVVFIAADIHGTLVNNLTYQKGPGQPQIQTNAFEISTGSVAFGQSLTQPGATNYPFGPAVFNLALAAGLITPTSTISATYNNPATPRAVKDQIIAGLVDSQLSPLGYDPLGLQGSSISATLTTGSYFPTHTFGWTEFDINSATQVLTVTTYGIDYYGQQEVTANPAEVRNRTPQVVSQFTVDPRQRTRLSLLAR